MICTPWRRSLCRSLSSVALLALTLTGCGAGKGEVSGTVTYQGKPVVFGTVSILGSDGILRPGNIYPDGSYIVRDVPTGPVKVAVYSLNPQQDYMMKVKLQMNPDSAAAIPKPDPEVVKAWFPISETYQAPETSGLTYEVKRGQNEYNIALDRPPDPKANRPPPATGPVKPGIGTVERLPPEK